MRHDPAGARGTQQLDPGSGLATPSAAGCAQRSRVHLVGPSPVAPQRAPHAPVDLLRGTEPETVPVPLPVPLPRPAPREPAGPRSVEGLAMIGWSHRSSRLELLEQVSLSRTARPGLLATLQEQGCQDVVVVSTCSRTELYVGPAGPELDTLLELVAQHLGRPAAQLAAAAERRTGRAVVDHLFAVAAGLESRVVGEGEIRRQVSGALRESQAAGLPLPTLEPVFRAAGRCARRVHEATGLHGHARSLARAAVDVGLAAVADPAGAAVDPAPAAVLVVGSGQMATTAVQRLRELGLRPVVAARSVRHAALLAGSAAVCPLSELVRAIAAADLVICATSASQDVVTLDQVRQAMASRRRPLTIVDLSVPRNVDVLVALVEGVRLVDVEDLDDDPVADRELGDQLASGRALARTAADRHVEDVAARAAGPLIAALRGGVEQLCLRELDKAGAGRIEPDVLRRAARAMAGKLLHQPTLAARAAAAHGDTAALQTICDLFAVPSRSLR